MGVLFAFFVGWSVGAKAGSQGFQEVADAVKTVKDSEEFASLLAITRTHVSSALHELSKLMSGETPLPDPVNLLERVQQLTSQRPL